MTDADPASAAPKSHAPDTAMSALLTVLQQLRDEMAQNRKVMDDQRKHLESLNNEVQGQRRLMRLILDQSASGLEEDISSTITAVQMSMAQTLDEIHDKRLSMARFGDGELMLITNPDHAIRFQRNSPDLQRDLEDALNPDWLAPGRVLVTLPPPFRGSLLWLGVWIATWPMLKSRIDPTRRYGHTLVTRPRFFMAEGAAGAAQWRRICEGRPILVVTGRGSRFDLLPELFGSAAKVEFFHTAPEHAYDERESILQGVLERARENTLVLLSLGPTATVLAHKIAAQGIQALDIGHISASYNHVFANGLLPEHMNSKRS